MIAPVVMPENPEFEFKSEKIAYWFFRLNGCLFLENFLVHHERRGREGTEIDMLSARFPFRQELLLTGEAMPDHPIFDANGKIDIILAEVKKGVCDINLSWLDPNKKNMERILNIIGFISPEQVDEVAQTLYANSYYEDASYRFRLFAFADRTNATLGTNIHQITWTDVLLFIHDRFSSYWKYKTQHRQWDGTGKKLFSLTKTFKPEKFVSYVLSNMKE